MAQLIVDQLCGALEELGRDFRVIDSDPVRRWDILAGERLQVLDAVLGRVIQELSDQAQSFMVGDMRGRFLSQRSTVEVVREVGLDDGGSDGRADGERVEDHACSINPSPAIEYGVRNRIDSGLPSATRACG